MAIDGCDTEVQASDLHANDLQTSEVQASDVQISDIQTSDVQASDTEVTNAKTTDVEADEGQDSVQASDAQKELFGLWAAGTDFSLDIHASLVNQFNILAKLLAWDDGGEDWNLHWKECFGEEYTRTAPDVTPGSATTVLDNATSLSSNTTPTTSDPGSSESRTNHSVWAKFEGFVPDPTAKFNNEFHRLAKQQCWTLKEKREYRVEMFDADFQAHIGNEVGDLREWQKLCRLCSIDPVPVTIPECIEALDDVLVNIYDLLDHQRTGEPIVPFDDFEDFAAYTRDGHTYPLVKAKADTFLPVFLKEINPHYRVFL